MTSHGAREPGFGAIRRVCTDNAARPLRAQSVRPSRVSWDAERRSARASRTNRLIAPARSG